MHTRTTRPHSDRCHACSSHLIYQCISHNAVSTQPPCAVPGMPVLVQWILDVMPKMAGVLMLCGFVFLVFGIVGKLCCPTLIIP